MVFFLCVTLLIGLTVWNRMRRTWAWNRIGRNMTLTYWFKGWFVTAENDYCWLTCSESTHLIRKTRLKLALKTSRAQDGILGVEHTCGAGGCTWRRLFATFQKNHIEVGFSLRWFPLFHWLYLKRYWPFYESSIKHNLLPDGGWSSLDLHHRHRQGQVRDSGRLVPQVVCAQNLKMRT